ncbi:MAG: hypothetical protein ACJAQ3_002091 [Planctomycetota bacterium]|jgi:hypothetical protein
MGDPSVAVRRAIKCTGLGVIVAVSVAYGIAIDHFRLFPYYPIRAIVNEVKLSRANTAQDEPAIGGGRWGTLRPGAAETGGSNKLAGIGYAGAYNEPSAASGARVYLPEQVMEGLTLFTSGHAPEAYLINEEGVVEHTWATTFEEMWPDGLNSMTLKEHKHFIRRARLLPDGALLVVFEYIGIGKLDHNSEVVWRNQGGQHHDLDVTEDGAIVALGSAAVSIDELRRKYPDLEFTGDILDNAIEILDSDGVELSRVSLLDAFYSSEFAQFLRNADSEGDIFHANSVDYIEGDLAEAYSLLEVGDVLISIRNLDAIVIYSTRTEKIKWVATGKWRQQHQAEALESGNIVVLDNQGGNLSNPLRDDRSRALEFEPGTLATVWEYPAQSDQELFTHRLGFIQRLANGNTLITESAQGHILEVSSEGEVVWEYYSPHRGGDDDELIANIMGAQRISPDELTFLKE